MKRLICLIPMVMLLCILLTACTSEVSTGSITVASKEFTENILLSEMYAQLIEDRTGLEVNRRQIMGNTAESFTEIVNGSIDLYIEYTGTIYTEILGRRFYSSLTSDEIFDIIKNEMNDANGITIFETMGPNNDYVMVMSRGRAEALGIETISDLSANSQKLVFASDGIFFARLNDGFENMAKVYNMKFMSHVVMEHLLLYDALLNDQADAVIVYATDSLLSRNDMVILEDDKQVFPDYYPLPIVRNDVLTKYPELKDVLNLLANSIDNEQMRELNYLVDVEKKEPKDVAKAFLIELELLPNN